MEIKNLEHVKTSKIKNTEQSLCHRGVSHSKPLPASNYTQPIRTKHSSSQYPNSARIIPQRKKGNGKSSQRKVTDAPPLQLTFLGILLQEARGEACRLSGVWIKRRPTGLRAKFTEATITHNHHFQKQKPGKFANLWEFLAPVNENKAKVSWKTFGIWRQKERKRLR